MPRHVLGFSLAKANAQPELSLEYCKDYTSKQTVRPHNHLACMGPASVVC
jgi:hypothetical protein